MAASPFPSSYIVWHTDEAEFVNDYMLFGLMLRRSGLAHSSHGAVADVTREYAGLVPPNDQMIK
jgi:hypothetical protein